MRNYTITFAEVRMCSENTSQYLREHSSNWHSSSALAISLQSRGLISITRFSVKSAVSVKKVSVSRTTAEIRLLKFLCDGTISTSNGQRRLWPCLSCADRFSANLPIPCARRVAITNNKSFAVFIAWKSPIVVPRFYFISALRRRRRCRSPSLFSVLLHAIVYRMARFHV